MDKNIPKIVFCKDCENFKKKNKDSGICLKLYDDSYGSHLKVKKYDFCSKGFKM